MRFCKIENDVVTNIISAEQSFIDTLVDTYIQDNVANIGWELISGVLEDTTVIYVPTLEENRVTKQKALNAYINNTKKSYEAPYDEVSLASFTDKRRDYYSSLSGGITPTVDLLCTDGGGVLDTAKRDALLIAIGNKVKEVLALEAYGDDTRTAIKNAVDQAALDIIVI